LGGANAKQIAQTAKIDHGEVYRQLEILQEKSLVEKILSIPTEYKPMPLNEATTILIQQKNKENAEIRKKVESLLKKGGHTDTFREEESRVSIIPRDEYRKIYSTRVVDGAQKEIIWYTQIERIPITQTYYSEAWKKAFARGIRFRTIAELSKPTDQVKTFIQNHKKEFPSWEIRFAKPTLFATFNIYDDKEMSFSTEKLTGLANSQILSTNNAQLIRVIKDYFELRWSTAMIEYPKKEDY
jgi:sugar-specific transcriptional regulator TrmB